MLILLQPLVRHSSLMYDHIPAAPPPIDQRLKRKPRDNRVQTLLLIFPTALPLLAIILHHNLRHRDERSIIHRVLRIVLVLEFGRKDLL